MHLAGSATLSGSSCFVALFNELWKQKLTKNFNYCLQKHYQENYNTVTSMPYKAGVTFC